MAHRPLVALGAPALLLLTTGGAAADPAPVADLLGCAGEYVLAYEDVFRLVVAEEVYVQRRRLTPTGPVRQTRRLASDVAFVCAHGTALPWWLFRDVYEVDGSAVRDRAARLEKLLVDGPPDGLRRARAIADENARFNLGLGFRNFNVPTLVLAFLHPSVQSRFSFRRKGRATIHGHPFVELSFRERAAPTLVSGPESQPHVLSSGRVWIEDGPMGTVGRTELVLEVCTDGLKTRAILTTEYRPSPALGLWAPVEMRDRVQTEPAGARRARGAEEVVDGFAAYSAFRQAGVTVREEFRSPVSQGR